MNCVGPGMETSKFKWKYVAVSSNTYDLELGFLRAVMNCITIIIDETQRDAMKSSPSGKLQISQVPEGVNTGKDEAADE